MKYIDADKLIAEIERQKKAEGWCEVGKDTADVYYARGFRFACDNLLSFITSLQQEQPEVDIKEEIDKTFSECINECTDGCDFYVEKFARHFYELGRLNARKED